MLFVNPLFSKYFSIIPELTPQVDIFRIFDSLNWSENMRVTIDAVIEAGKLCEASICYTGDITDQARKKYDLQYYIKEGRKLKSAGIHILGIKDMAGLSAHMQKHATILKPKFAAVDEILERENSRRKGWLCFRVVG